MDPFTMMLLGGTALQGVGSIMGAKKESKANAQNALIAERNYNLEREMFERGISEAERQRQEAHLGTTDEYGNRLYFDPQRGWVTDLTGDSQAIADQQLREELMQLHRDAPQRRRAEDANEAMRGTERGTAQALMDEFRRIEKQDPERMRAMLYDRARMGIDEGHDDAMSTAMKQALRTGNSNTGAIAAALGQSKGDALRKASLDAAISAEDRSRSNYNQDRTGVASLYNSFASRASQLPGTSYRPSDVGSGTEGHIGQFAGAGDNANARLLAAFKGSPDQPFMQPDMSTANAITSLGSQVAGLGNTLESRTRYNNALDLNRQLLNKKYA